MINQIMRNGNEKDVPTLVLAQLARLDGAIEKEFTLVSDRMTWTIISESFIFGAFVSATVNYDPKQTFFGYVVLSLILVLPVLGIIIAAFAYRAITAAHTSIDQLKARREPLEQVFVGWLRVDLVSSNLHTHAEGNIPPRYLPPVIIFAWTLFLLVAIVQQFATQTVAGVVTVTMLLIFMGFVLYLARRTFIKRITDLELKVQELTSRNQDQPRSDSNS